MKNNSCLTCILASNDDRMNGYLDLKCNIGYEKGWNLVPFQERSKRIDSENDIEEKLPCKYHLTADDIIKLKGE